jgi:hypothetical protein
MGFLGSPRIDIDILILYIGLRWYRSDETDQTVLLSLCLFYSLTAGR